MKRLPASPLTDLARQMIQGSLVGLMTIAPVAAAFGQTGETVMLHGTAFDFRNSHPDFSVVPSHGNGHYAGNVSMMLGPDGVPVFTNAGYRVSIEWRDASSTPIAPHLYMEGGASGIYLVSPPSIHGSATLDTWDSTVGPYGGDNVGPAPAIYTGSTMPVIDVPESLIDLDHDGNVTVDGGTISADMRCGSLKIRGDVLVSGHVSLLVQREMRLESHSSLELMDGASLTVYVTGGVRVQPHASLNATSDDPKRVSIYNLGSHDVRLSQPHGAVYAQVVSPNGPMRVQPDSEFFGTFIGQTLTMEPDSSFHADMLAGSVCGDPLNDTAGTQGPASSGGIANAGTFAQWYDDVLGVNMAQHHALTLQRDADGVWEYLDDEFYPIDGRGFGNGSLPHNYYFTYTLDAEFTFEACGGQFIEFVGSDDMWVYINGELVMDIGGVIPAVTQRVDLDRLDLVDGQPCRMRLFYAQRQSNHAVFRLRTSIDFEDDGGLIRVSGVFD